MNQHPDDTAAGRGRPSDSKRRGARTTWIALLLATLIPMASGTAQSPATSGIERLVAADARSSLESPDPVLRGEAALVVAQTGGLDVEYALLQLAESPEVETRHRAILALGLLATPNAILRLEGMLNDVEERAEPDGVVAAYALGIADPQKAGTAPARMLTLFPRGSWRRQHDCLMALLLGMSTHPQRNEAGALRLLYEDDSNRDGDARAQLLRVLLPIDASFEADELRTVLRRGSEPEQQAVLDNLAHRAGVEDRELRRDLERIARRDRAPERRAAALRALTRSGDLVALDLATRALQQNSALECGQGLATIFALGGASARGTLANHIIHEPDARKKAALLREYSAPPTAALLAHAVEIAADTACPIGTRVAAAELVARGDAERSLPLLRSLFRVADDPDHLLSLARALGRAETEATELSRLLERPHRLAAHPARWRALLIAGHPLAQREVLAVLRDADAPVEDRRVALGAWRAAMVLATPAANAPAVLRNALR